MELKQKISRYIQKRKAIKQARLRHEFLSEAMEIIEKPASPLGHFVVFLTATAVVLTLIWACVGRMDEVVSARGKIITVSGIQNIQTVNGGVVDEILVKEGDYVTAGQTIVVLDASIQKITLDNNMESKQLLEFENQLLGEILEGKNITKHAEEITSSDEQKVYQYVLSMQEGYEAQKKKLQTVVNQASSQVEMAEINLNKMLENEKFLTEQKSTLEGLGEHSNTQELTAEKLQLSVAYLEKQVKDYKVLYEAGAISKAELEQCEQELKLLKKDHAVQEELAVYEDFDNSMRMVEVDNQLSLASEDSLVQEQSVELAKQQHEQALKDIEALTAEYEASISDLIVKNEEKIRTNESEENIQTIELEESKIVSPVDGVIKTLEIGTEGGVLTPAQIVATVVPNETSMQAEVDVLNQDIGFVQAGQEISMKLDTYNFQKYGKLDGCVVAISPDAIFDERKGWIYKVKLSINDEKFKEKASEYDVAIGMEGTAEIKVSDRRIIDFFLEPLADHFDGSLKIR